jgi:citrate lyase subunit beta / citryl-CoA lyase
MSVAPDLAQRASGGDDGAEHARSALTWLFVPGDRPERFPKAAGSGADALILDLEDAVAPEAKERARRFVKEYLLAGNPAYVRINGDGTEPHAADLAALADLGRSLRGVMVPKSEHVATFDEVDRVLPQGAVAIALIETAAGVHRAYKLSAAPRVTRLAFGSADLMLQAAIEDEPRGLLLARSTLVLASRAAGLEGPIDGITTALDDPAVARRDAEDGRRLGFAGKLCLHPRQIAPVLQGFAPSVATAEWASRVLDAVAQAHGQAVRFDGQMIDRPLLERAQRISARQHRIEAMITELKRAHQ